MDIIRLVLHHHDLIRGCGVGVVIHLFGAGHHVPIRVKRRFDPCGVRNNGDASAWVCLEGIGKDLIGVKGHGDVQPKGIARH